MRKMMFLLALAGAAAGCTNDGSSDMQYPETASRLTAELQPGSRTVLGDDGLKVLWEDQDRLGVFSDKGDANVSFLLSEGAGESVGLFEGALSKGAVPQYVYYPYSPDAGVSTTSLAVTIDAVQTQNGATASIGANDFKIGSYDAEQKRFSLHNKLSLLAFTIDDLTGTELAGQPLDKIVFTVQNRDLAGDFTADLTAPAAALKTVSAVSEVTLSFSEKPALETSVSGWLLVNPVVMEGDPMSVTIYAGSKKATLTAAASKNYEAGMRYTMPLHISTLVADGSMTIETLSEPLPTPEIKVFRKTHGMIVAEFVQSIDDYETHGRTFNIQLMEGDQVLRSYDKYSFKYGAKNGTIYSYLYNRYAFGGLKASTTYTIRVQAVSLDNARFDDSSWASLDVTTEAVPELGEKVLLYKDFEDSRYGGSSIDNAWAHKVKDSQASIDWTEEAIDDVLAVSVCHPMACLEDVFGTKQHVSYRTVHWSDYAWSSDTADNIGIFPVCGALKFGSASAIGKLTTPTMSSLGVDAATNVVLSFNAAPYYEPNLATGMFETAPNVGSGTTFVVTINGDGTFTDGTQMLTLHSRTPVETGADAKGYMEYTLHTLPVTGVTGATTFTIATSLDGTGAVTGSNSCRMWLDDLRIERE